ncbi:aldehyde dehydrogenase [Ramaria rubella]|nr:aldehyde dehydrogenase [Ramaria rubella]
MMSLPTSLLWINGSQRASSTGQTYDVHNAASQVVVGHAAAASSQDAVEAILAADKVQPAWEAIPLRAKRDIFLKAAELIKSSKYAESIVESVQQETSALESWGHSEVVAAASVFLEAATTVTHLRGETQPSGRNPDGTVLIERRALGTVFAISPSNSPVNLAVRAVAVPLACGNAVILKSSEISPRCAGIVVEALHEAGLPKGVLNLLHIAKEDVPKIVSEIIGHKLIRHINFTGSDYVGKIIAAEAAKYLKPCVFELGGKSAAIVLNDADVEEAARSIIYGSMFHSGQICMSNERVIVQRDMSSPLIDALTNLARKIQASTSPRAHLSPLFSTTSAEKVLSLVTDAHTRGGQVLVGDLVRDGAVIQPHIILGVEPGWPLWEKESFGPVFAMKVVDTEEEAVEMANRTDYSLMGAVWTQDLQKGLRVARRIRAGQVLINGPTFAPEPGTGVHGLGGATGYGEFDIENFTQRRTIVITPPGLKLPLVSDL